MEDPSHPSYLEDFLDEDLSPENLLDLMESFTFLESFRHRPTDVELVRHYLEGKINRSLQPIEEILVPEVSVYKFDPWILEDRARFRSGDSVWLFFLQRARRDELATPYGFWLRTGEEEDIREAPFSDPIGKKRTLVYCQFGVKHETGTKWIIHEFTIAPEEGCYVLCRLTKNAEGVTNRRLPVTLGVEAHDWHSMASSSGNHVTIEAEADNCHQNMASSSSNPVTVEAEAQDVRSDDDLFQWPDSVIELIDNDDYTYSHMPLRIFPSFASPVGAILSTEESLQGANVEQYGGIHSNDSGSDIPISDGLNQQQNVNDSGTEMQGAGRFDYENVDNA